MAHQIETHGTRAAAVFARNDHRERPASAASPVGECVAVRSRCNTETDGGALHGLHRRRQTGECDRPLDSGRGLVRPITAWEDT
jgi:hypothetical protein